MFEQLEDKSLLSTVGVIAPSSHVQEGSQAFFYVTVNPPSSSLVTANYQTNPGTALQDTDYQGVTGSVTIYPGQPYGVVVVPTFHDFATESGETFSLTITGATGATVGSPSSATITIDDVPPSGTPPGILVAASGGDGTVDSGDDDVRLQLDPETGLTVNWSEVDLMRLIIDRPVNYVPGERLFLFSISPNTAFWKHFYKGEAAGDIIFAAGEQAKEVWVEQRDYSEAVRDISIVVLYRGEADLVKATAVWAKRTNEIYALKEVNPATMTDEVFTVAPWNELQIGDNVRREVITSQGTGMRPGRHAGGEWFLENVMMMQFTVYPVGITSEPQVKWDVTRRIEYNALRMDSTGNIVTSGTRFPKNLDERNDDAHAIDESGSISGHLYVMDANGPSTDADERRAILFATFEEYVRVRVDGVSPQGTDSINSFSRASTKSPWHSQINAERSGDNVDWTRRATGNTLDDGWLDVNTPPQ